MIGSIGGSVVGARVGTGVGARALYFSQPGSKPSARRTAEIHDAVLGLERQHVTEQGVTSRSCAHLFVLLLGRVPRGRNHREATGRLLAGIEVLVAEHFGQLHHLQRTAVGL